MRRFLGACLLFVLVRPVSAQDPELEYRVKAAYLFNFTKFVDWPVTATDGGNSFAICIAGRNPFGAALSSTLVGEKVAGLPLAARVVDPAGASSCQVLFVPRSVAAAPYLRAVAGAPVLTVGETPEFLAQGGVINFVLADGRVRFEISQMAAERAQLKVSSRLLQLGRGVAAESAQ
jgi:YfiR/HmsC-like